MDKTESYRHVIEEILAKHASFPDPYFDVTYQVVADRQHDQYLLLVVGWEGNKRLHDCMIHVEIVNGRFWIQEDGTEYGVANELIDQGVPEEDIVLAFHPAELRPYTGLAVA
jgi:hypothetical protein